MNTLPKTLTLFTIIILEGYIVLSAELLAIRQTLPFVGSGTDTVSIIIAAVLMPLALGYYNGGKFKPGFHNGQYTSIRKQLGRNLLIAQYFLFFGLSYALLSLFFVFLISNGYDNRLLLASLYALLFLVVPVYMLGQTVPLISRYFSKKKLAPMTGRILFFSTLGSFLGAVVPTLALMSTIGVHSTASVIFVLLTFLTLVLNKKKFSEPVILSIAVMAVAIYMNSGYMMAKLNIVENNRYNTIAVFEDETARYLSLNNNNSSRYGHDGSKHLYAEIMEDLVLDPVYAVKTPRNILIVGAGGFTIGLEDTFNNYDYVDIDGSLKHIAEKYFLKQKLSPNKKFYPLPIRAYLSKTGKKYDVIILDAYKSGLSIPEHLVTQEFFRDIKTRLKDGGVVMANIADSPVFSTRFSRTLDNTFRSVFPHVSRLVPKGEYVPRDDNADGTRVNAIYIYRHYPDEDPFTIFADAPANEK